MKKYLFLIAVVITCAVFPKKYSTWLTESPADQLNREGADDQLGFGRLFVPVMSFAEWEPYLRIYNSAEGSVSESERPGRSVFLRPGRYTLLFGSSEDPVDLVQKNFIIHEHHTTMIEPDWSGLVVNVINENMENIRFGYEIMHLTSGSSAGSRYSREESSFNDMNYTWILPPGKYKVVKQGEPFNTIVNFTTFELKPGELTEIVIVVNSLQQFTGAGELGLLENYSLSKKAWFNKLALKGTVSLYSHNKLGEGENTTDIISQAKIDNRFIFDSKPYYLNLRQSLKEEWTKSGNSEEMRVSFDELALKNTAIYYFTNMLGVYTEINLETKIFPNTHYEIGTDTVRTLMSNGTEYTYAGLKTFRLSAPFSPLATEERMGINLTFLKSSNSNLYLRTGFGFRQVFNIDVFAFSGITGPVTTFTQQKDSFSKGLIITAGADFNMPGNITYSSTANFFYDLDENGKYNIEWENDVIFKIFRYMSVDYSFSLSYDHVAGSAKNYWIYDHQLALEFSYYINR